MATNQKEATGTILAPIYFNKSEESQVRLAALSLLLVSNPPQVVWQRIALSTWFESDDQISHYIYTAVTSLAANQDPSGRQVILGAESILSMMKPMPWTYFSSAHRVKSGSLSLKVHCT